MRQLWRQYAGTAEPQRSTLSSLREYAAWDAFIVPLHNRCSLRMGVLRQR